MEAKKEITGIQKFSHNILAKIVSYLRNKEILESKLICRKFYALLSDTFTRKQVIETTKPKQAMENIRNAILSLNKQQIPFEEFKEILSKNIQEINLLSLNLSNLNIQNSELIKSICAALSHEPNFIERLWLNCNNLSKETIVPLACFIEKSNKILELLLRSTKLSKIELEKICSAISLNKTLHSLDLSENALGAPGAECISEMIKRNRSIERLYLRKTSLGKDGVEIILDALQYNTTLRRLHLEENKVNAKQIKGKSNGITKIFI